MWLNLLTNSSYLVNTKDILVQTGNLWFNIHREDPTLNLAFRVWSALITLMFVSRYNTNNMLFFYIRKWAQLANFVGLPLASSAEWLPASARPMSNSLTSFSVVQKPIAALAALALLNVATILTYFIRDKKKIMSLREHVG